MNEKNIDLSHVNRIAEKMRKGDSLTATYATPYIDSVLQSIKTKGRPREDTLAKVINPYIDSHPEADLEEVKCFLQNEEAGDVIYSVTDNYVEWYSQSDKKVKKTPMKALSGRIFRRRKKNSAR